MDGMKILAMMKAMISEPLVKIGNEIQKINKNVMPEAEPEIHQMLTTDGDGNPKWEDSAQFRKRVTIKHPGDMSEGTTDTPGSASSLVNGIVRLIKVSDEVPAMGELFAEDTVLTVKDYTTGDSKGYPDAKYVFEGGYGRWKMSLIPYESSLSDDGTYPGIVVVTTPTKVNDTWNCYEPGTYMWAGSLGESWGVPEIEYTTTIPINEEHISEILPENVPVIETASAGQVATVKTVDEDGKPTEWEAESLPDHIKTIFIQDNSAYPGGNNNILVYDTEKILKGSEVVNLFRGFYLNEVPFVIRNIGIRENGLKWKLPLMSVKTWEIQSIEGGFRLRLHFSEEYADLLFSSVDDSIIIDPDWVAPAEVALKSEVEALAEEKLVQETAAVEIVNGAGKAVAYNYEFDMNTYTMVANGIKLAGYGESICGILSMDTPESIKAGDPVTIQHNGIGYILLGEDCEKGYELEAVEGGVFTSSITKVDAFTLEAGAAGKYVRANIISGADIGMKTIALRKNSSGELSCDMTNVQVQALYGSTNKIRAVFSYNVTVDGYNTHVLREAVKIVRFMSNSTDDVYFRFSFLTDDGRLETYQLNFDNTVVQVTD